MGMGGRGLPRRTKLLDPPLTLRVAVWLVWLQAIVQVIGVAVRDELRPGLRIGLALVIGLQILFAERALRGGPGAVLGLFACEAMAVLGAIVADNPIPARIVLASMALAVIVLVAMSLHAFDTPTLPRSSLP